MENIPEKTDKKKQYTIPTWLLYVIAGMLGVLLVVQILMHVRENKKDRAEETSDIFAEAVNETKNSGSWTDAAADIGLDTPDIVETSHNEVEIRFISDNEADIYIYNKNALEEEKKSGFKINMLGPWEDGMVFDKCYIELRRISDLNVQYDVAIMEESKENPEYNTYYPVYIDVEEAYRKPVVTDSYILCKIKTVGIKAMLDDCRGYEITELENYNTVASGSSDDISVIAVDPETAKASRSVPEEFITNENDRMAFVPDTDRYHLIDVVFEDSSIPRTGWYTDAYGMYFWSVNERDISGETTDIHLMYLISFDEFGAISGKIKMSYDSEEMRIRKCFRCEPVYPYDHNGINEPDDAYVDSLLPGLIRESEDAFVSYVTDDRNSAVSFVGSNGNTRYFEYTIPETDAIHGGYLPAMWVSFTDHFSGDYRLDQALEFRKGETVEADSAKYGVKVRTYSSF